MIPFENKWHVLLWEVGTDIHATMNEWMFNDTPARKADRLLGVSNKCIFFMIALQKVTLPTPPPKQNLPQNPLNMQANTATIQPKQIWTYKYDFNKHFCVHSVFT